MAKRVLFKRGTYAIRVYQGRQPNLPPKGTVVQFERDVTSDDEAVPVRWLDSRTNQYKVERVYLSTLTTTDQDLGQVFKPEPSYEKGQRLTTVRAYGHLSEREVVEYLSDDGERANIQAIDGTYWVPLIHLVALTSEKVGTILDANHKLNRHLRHDFNMAKQGLALKQGQIDELSLKVADLHLKLEDQTSSSPCAEPVMQGVAFASDSANDICQDLVIMHEISRLFTPVDLMAMSPEQFSSYKNRISEIISLIKK